MCDSWPVTGSRVIPVAPASARARTKSSRASFDARARGDYAHAVEHAREAVTYAPDLVNYRVQLMDALFAANDLPGVQAAASEEIGRAHV